MTPKGADLAATDLIEVSTLEAGSYVTKSITGQELIDAIPLPPSGLTIGTTPIASGTIGRVLFEGTGNVLQQSANLFWDNTNLRLGINGTPTSPLEIFYNPTGISNTIGLTLNSGSTGSTLKAIRFTAGTFGELGTFGVNTGSGEFRWATSASYFPTIYSNGAERLRIPTTGNVLINTTTDAGFRLDVNGTARVSGASYFGTATGNVGIGTTDASTPFGTAKGLVINAGAGNDAQIRLQNTSTGNTLNDGGLLSISNVTMYLWNYEPAPLIFGVGNAERMRIFSTGNVGINTTTDAGFRLDVNGTARVQGNLSVTGTSNLTGFVNVNGAAQSVAGLNTNRFCANTDAMIGSASAPDASAVLETRSTTRGFLPPRMTTTQRNAIASPAAGLIVYDTTLNLPHFFNGTIWVSL
jgi:hypothetical protein